MCHKATWVWRCCGSRTTASYATRCVKALPRWKKLCENQPHVEFYYADKCSICKENERKIAEAAEMVEAATTLLAMRNGSNVKREM